MLAQCQGTQGSVLQLKQEDCDMLRLGIDRSFFFLQLRIEVIS